jgi:NAD(P)-dependent dehydrogenase (short-subunit alcohol dehydrogenase family)
MPELDGKVAIVTGAGRLRGIGRAAAVAFARLGVTSRAPQMSVASWACGRCR